jgi:hypothetical protein
MRQVGYTALFIQAPIDKDLNCDKMILEERKGHGVVIKMS